jgi:DMSO/TMAO reductase YedYZ molybdopterin-dependent catalytic subunit
MNPSNGDPAVTPPTDAPAQPSRLLVPRRAHLAEQLGIDRRRFVMTGSGALGALFLAACDSLGPKSAQSLLKFAERKNESLERVLFRHTAMDVPSAGAVPAGTHFPAYFVSPHVPVWDEATRGPWHLKIDGMVDRPLRLSLTDLAGMTRTGYKLDHFCVEGWTALSMRSGVLLADIAKLAGVQRGATYVDFQSFDTDYHESWDIDSAMHPQTLIVYAQDGHYLNASWGAPARVFSPVKLGYKNTKYLTKIVFMSEPNGGYWTDRGYEWYGGV